MLLSFVPSKNLKGFVEGYMGGLKSLTVHLKVLN